MVSCTALVTSEFSVDQKLRSHDHRNKETRDSIEQLHSRLTMHICYVTEIPRDQKVSLVDGSDRHVQSVRHILAMKYSSRDIALREDRRFFADFKHRHIPNKIKIGSASRL